MGGDGRAAPLVRLPGAAPLVCDRGAGAPVSASIPRESIEQLETTITATVDPTSSTVEWSFPVSGSRPSDWTAGAWGDVTEVQSRYQAVTVSPSVGAVGSGADVELAAGTRHEVFVRVTDLSEQPVRSAGVLVLS